MDGICLQTSESIGCAEELGLPAVVVLNKIDLLPDDEAAQVSSSFPYAQLGWLIFLGSNPLAVWRFAPTRDDKYWVYARPLSCLRRQRSLSHWLGFLGCVSEG